MNRTFLIGNLTKDIELNTTASGIDVARFTLAVSRRFTNADGERVTDFFNIVVWRELAKNCHKYLKKGSKCSVVGELQNRSYEAQDGTKRQITEIIANEVEFLSTKQSEAGGNEGFNPTNKQEKELEPIDEDNLPF